MPRQSVVIIGWLAIAMWVVPMSTAEARESGKPPLPVQLVPTTPAVKAEVEQSYRRYVDCFNAQNFDCFADYYTADMEYGEGTWHTRSRAEFLAFYRKAWTRVREHITIHSIEMRGATLVADISNHIVVFEDFPDFPVRPLAKGADYVIRGKMGYSMRNGRFARIKGAESDGAASFEPIDLSGPMTHEKYARYIDTFNRHDLRFVEFYAEDVAFDKGKADGVLKGREAIAEWYRNIWPDLTEKVTPQAVTIDSAQNLMIVELRTELTATRDGVQRPNMTLNRGDQLVVDGAVVYSLRDGFISSLRGVSTERYAKRVNEERPPVGAGVAPQRKVVLISRIKARAGRGNELESAIHEFYRKVREAEPGCLVNVMHRPAPPPGRAEGDGGFTLSSAQTDTFTFYEVYADAAAAAGHTKTPHFQALMAKLDGLIDGKIELEFLDELDAK